MAMSFALCAVYAWCRIDHSTGVGEREPDFHVGTLTTAIAGTSEVDLVVSVGEDGDSEMELQLNEWSLTPATLDKEFSDIREIIGQLEAAAREFDVNDRLNKAATE